MLPRSELQHFQDVAVQAASAAEPVIRHYFTDRPPVRIKADRTPVTVADEEAEREIRSVIQGAFPDHGFYGEELGRSASGSDYLWLVDPIDGTRSFVRGTPFFSTQIALSWQGRVVVGVSSAPIYGELACAMIGCGATLNGEPVRTSTVADVAAATISIGNLKTMTQGSSWTNLGMLLSRAERVRGYGDFCHYHMLAAGKVDAVIESDVNILDIAALSLIVTEAGGRFTDLAGRPVNLGITSVLATNAALYPAIRAILGSHTSNHGDPG